MPTTHQYSFPEHIWQLSFNYILFLGKNLHFKPMFYFEENKFNYSPNLHCALTTDQQVAQWIVLRVKASQSWPLQLGHMDFKKSLKFFEPPLKLIKFFYFFFNFLTVWSKTELTPVYISKSSICSSWVRKSKQKVKTMLLVDLKLQFFRYGTTWTGLLFSDWLKKKSEALNLDLFYHFWLIFGRF